MNHGIICVLASLSLFAVAACGSDSDDGGSAGAPSGGAKKGESCKVATDCAGPSAICINGTTCSGTIDAAAFSTECASGGAEGCAGLRCIGFKDNKQSKTGICSMSCATDADCGGAPNGVCVTLAANLTCLKPCTSSADCLNGFVCVPDPVDASRSACLVEAL